MKKSYLPVCLVIVLAACTQPDQKKETPSPTADTVTVIQTDTAPPARATKGNTHQNIQVDSVIYLAFSPGSNSLSVKAHMNAAHSPVICYLPVTTGSKLTASIVPDKRPANIRFNQIFLPDGRSDGPFGQTLDYDLPQKGMYKLYIGPSLMASDAYTGDFRLQVKVE